MSTVQVGGSELLRDLQTRKRFNYVEKDQVNTAEIEET